MLIVFSGPVKLLRYVSKDGKYVISKYEIRKWLQNNRRTTYKYHYKEIFNEAN